MRTYSKRADFPAAESPKKMKENFWIGGGDGPATIAASKAEFPAAKAAASWIDTEEMGREERRRLPRSRLPVRPRMLAACGIGESSTGAS